MKARVNLEQAARELYAACRQLIELGPDLTVPNTLLGDFAWNRIVTASHELGKLLNMASE